MRVGLLAPLLERIPPGNYGGTERVMAWLADELVALGLDVDLFASGDCDTRARLVSLVPRALWHDEGIRDYTAVRVAALARAYAIAAVDVMHDHAELLAYPLARAAAFPTVSTLHSRTDTRECAFVYDEFREHPLVAISHAQRRPLPKANWVATVHHGMPADLYRPSYARGSYLAFVGRIAPEKGVHLAIEVARRTGLPLKIAGRPPLEEWKYLEARTDHEYYETMVRPYLGTDGIEYVGELDDAGKQDLYEGALALLFPIDWPEPFGLVLIEAMACGTPILARPRGSVPEIVTDGVNGFHCEDVGEMTLALDRIDRIDREACRREFDARFTARRMALDYLAVYERMTARAVRATEAEPESEPGEPTELGRSR
ncbi:MAG TPA: glycosyltransferase family 4 protein [Candidatus Limnocylindria bacterium]